MLGQNVAFRLDGDPGFIHDRPAARAALLAEAARNDAVSSGVCLITGKSGPLARIHPSIRGVAGAQSTGSQLVSYNLDAFNSYGKVQGSNAPVSECTAFAYATALNALLAASDGTDPQTGRPRYRNRISLGGDTVVFWAESAPGEELVKSLLAPTEQTETVKVPKVLEDIRGRRQPIRTASDVTDRARVYVLGLSPNAGRLSVRFWVDTELGEFTNCLAAHWSDLRLDPAPKCGQPAAWALLRELSPQRNIENVPANLVGDLMRAILTGAPYPASLLTHAIMRLRADHQVTWHRAALIKAVIIRSTRYRERVAHTEWKDPLVSLDRQEPNAGYRLGRLVAVLAAAQYAAIGQVNTGVKDAFFRVAFATPSHVFPFLLRRVQDYVATARRRGWEARAARLDRETSEILNKFADKGPLPAMLSLEDQGRFVIGFYHQDAEFRVPQ